MGRIHVMVNGIPGNMAANVAGHVIEDDRFELIPFSLTGPEIEETEHSVDGTRIHLIHPSTRDAEIKKLIQDNELFITVDYTHPSAVNDNVKFYCETGLPFVMGTTGGDRDKLSKVVESSPIAAVIAPNMAKQIVGFQAMMEYASTNFPGIFNGYSLDIKESHQKGKADTSGTAKAMVKYFNNMGTPFSEDAILKERDPETQKNEWQIPEDYLAGHAWHTYTLISSDKTVCFEFTHNVNGRDVYSRGTLDAVEYLY
ncbi:MAG: dihydrodipicolinate reductase, partial [Deltaproteobacteria bacterium]|nr:dihydrodipicolinate reductase [Deltaproteobacteria bacterium]